MKTSILSISLSFGTAVIASIVTTYFLTHEKMSNSAITMDSLDNEVMAQKDFSPVSESEKTLQIIENITGRLETIESKQLVYTEDLLKFKSDIDVLIGRLQVNNTSSATNLAMNSSDIIETPVLTMEEQYSDLEDRVSYEDLDPDWSLAMEQKIMESFEGGSYEKSSFISSSCKSTVCRLAVAHENELAMDKFANSFPFSIEWEGVYYFKVEFTNNQPTTIVYLYRE